MKVWPEWCAPAEAFVKLGVCCNIVVRIRGGFAGVGDDRADRGGRGNEVRDLSGLCMSCELSVGYGAHGETCGGDGLWFANEDVVEAWEY